MSGVVKINISEAPATLKTLLGQQKTARGKERVQALYLLKTKQVETVQHLMGLKQNLSPNKAKTSFVSGKDIRIPRQPIKRPLAQIKREGITRS